MSFPKFEHSIPKDPQNFASAYERLRGFLESENRSASGPKVYSSNRMFDVAGGVPSTALVQALSNLISEGLVQVVVRVEPRYGEGLGDFASIEEVPNELEDWRHPGNVVTVLPEHLKIYYKLLRTTNES